MLTGERTLPALFIKPALTNGADDYEMNDGSGYIPDTLPGRLLNLTGSIYLRPQAGNRYKIPHSGSAKTYLQASLRSLANNTAHDPSNEQLKATWNWNFLEERGVLLAACADKRSDEPRLEC
jgi:hypothetical protein